MRTPQRPSSDALLVTKKKDPLSRAKAQRAVVRKERKGSLTKEIALYREVKAPRQKPEAKLRAIVRFRTSPGHSWKEVTTPVNVSKSGASFLLKRPCDVGRLIMLVITMPVELRAYDFDEEFYPVIGLIQNCHEVFDQAGEVFYSVGVAFVGKDVPPGWDLNPTQNYRISGTTASGMWQIKAASDKFRVREATRYWVSLDVTISLLRTKNITDYKQQTVTCNVSAKGAMVICSLEVAIGDRVKFASKEKDFYSICIVRDRQVKPGKLPFLHLEFVDARFPVERIPAVNVTAVTAG